MIRDSVLLDQSDEIRRRVSRQRGLTEMRVGREEIVGPAMQIGKVTAAASGDEDLLADTVGVLQHGHTAATLASLDGTH